ncbi:conserved hypothetical protein [Ricinus communis]|uniref:Uncharacterized protein n=1 Tax=Ricinus communis TaxID=3988 RepID=B9T6X6_RICCO|nr:conserved hypothetical protein [Ricinus communis]
MQVLFTHRDGQIAGADNTKGFCFFFFWEERKRREEKRAASKLAEFLYGGKGWESGWWGVFGCRFWKGKM